MGGSAPAAPDTIGAAYAQAQLDLEKAKQATAANRPISQETPFGNQWWTDMGNGRWTSKTFLNKPQQQILDQQQKGQLEGAKFANTAQDIYSKEVLKDPASLTAGLPSWMKLDTNGLPAAGKLDYNSLGGMPNLDYSKLGAMPVASNATRKRVEDAIYNRAKSRLDPRINQEERSLNNRLVQMGFMPGAQASNKALSNFGRTKNDAYQNAINEAIMGGGVEQSRLFDLAMKGRQQGVTEAGNIYGAGMEKRKQGVSELDKKFQALNEGRATALGERSLSTAANNELRSSILGERQGLQGNRLTDLMAAMSLRGPTVGMPTFPDTYQQQTTQGADIGGATQANYQNQMGRYNASQANKQAGIGAGVAAASAIAIIA